MCLSQVIFFGPPFHSILFCLHWNRGGPGVSHWLPHRPFVQGSWQSCIWLPALSPHQLFLWSLRHPTRTVTLAHETATSLPMIPSRSIKGLHLTSIEHPSHFDPDPASSSLSHPSWKTCRSQQSFKCIPLAQLSRQDPILLYAEVSLLKMNYTITEPRHGKNCSYLLYILFFVLFHKIADN